MQVAVFFHLKGEGGFSHHEHIAFQRLVALIAHLTVDLGDQLAGAGIKEKAAFIAGDEVREFLFECLIHLFDDFGIHGCIDDQFSFHVLIDGKSRSTQAQEKRQREYHRDLLFHGVSSIPVYRYRGHTAVWRLQIIIHPAMP